MQAPSFRNDIKIGKACIKEFMDDEGKTFLVFCFSDGSIGVYRRKKGSGKAIADYEPISEQKTVLRRLLATDDKEKTTYQLGRELCEK